MFAITNSVNLVKYDLNRKSALSSSIHEWNEKIIDNELVQVSFNDKNLNITRNFYIRNYIDNNNPSIYSELPWGLVDGYLPTTEIQTPICHTIQPGCGDEPGGGNCCPPCGIKPIQATFVTIIPPSFNSNSLTANVRLSGFISVNEKTINTIINNSNNNQSLALEITNLPVNYTNNKYIDLAKWSMLVAGSLPEGAASANIALSTLSVGCSPGDACGCATIVVYNPTTEPYICENGDAACESRTCCIYKNREGLFACQCKSGRCPTN